MSNQSRTPAGVPTGGEFASNGHDEAGALVAPATDEYGYRIGQRYEWDGEAMTPEDALQDWIDNNEVIWDDLGFDSEDEAREAVFMNTRWDAPAIVNLEALHAALDYHGISNDKVQLPTRAIDAYEFDGRIVTGHELRGRLLERGDISPAAVSMPIKDVIHQYNEANALSEGDDDYVRTVYEAEDES